MKKNIMWLICSLVVIATIIFFLSYFFSRDTQKNDSQVIETLAVKKSDPLTFTGISKSKNKQFLNFNQQLGETIFVEKQDGDAVKIGDLLASYYSLEVNNSLIEKQKRIRDIESDLQSIDETNQEDELEVTSLTDKKKNLENEIKTLKTYAVAKIYADFNGTFQRDTTANYEAGDVLGTVASDDSLVEIETSEYDIEKLNSEMMVELTYNNKKDKLEGQIITIPETAINTNSKISSYAIGISPSERIKNGYHMKVSIPTNDIKVPISAIKKEDSDYYVYKKKDNKFKKTKVELEEADNYYIVKSGLNEKDKIAKDVTHISSKDLVIE